MPQERPEPRSDPGTVLAGSIGFMLSKLGFLCASRFAGALEPLGIHPGHFGLLRMIDAAGPDSQHALSETLGILPSRMVALIDELEAMDLVERRRSPEDRRVNLVDLTEAGHVMLEQASEAGAAWEAELLADLDASERDVLLNLLQRIAAAHDLPIGVHPGMR